MSATMVRVLLVVTLLGAGIPAVEPQLTILPFTVDHVRLDIISSEATLKFCAADPLLDGTLTLNYGEYPSGNGQTTVDGIIDATDPCCANFIMDATFTLPDVLTRYEILIEKDSEIGRGVTVFAMTAKTAFLTCGTEVITKVTWEDSSPIAYVGDCIETDAAIDDAFVCYHYGDVTDGDFCFGITDQEGVAIQICMSGLEKNSVEPSGTLSAKYLYYGPDVATGTPRDATLSLDIGVDPATASTRAIVRLAALSGNPGTRSLPHVYDCPGSVCNLKGYTRAFAKYEVCAEVIDDMNATPRTATTTFTDINLNVFPATEHKDNILIEFVFVNGLESMKYAVDLFDDEPAPGLAGDALTTITVDCTQVALDTACFGFLDAGLGTENVYLALSDDGGTNTVIVPYDIGVAPPPGLSNL